MKEDPILSDLRILNLANETNYPITFQEATRLQTLLNNTGRNWNRTECMAALWAYDQTYGKSVSRKPGSPVADVAIAIGRAVSGTYNKLMNYRSIDPSDTRTGLDAINQLDQAVWDTYYDVSESTLRSELLREDYEQRWGSVSVPTDAKPEYQEFGQAPDDDPTDLRQFAARVRKGQQRFRANLLRLYDKQCAISGWGPPAVLDAAHIVSHGRSGLNHTDNGILLRSDLHDLFDCGLLVIQPDLKVSLDPSLQGSEYWQYDGVMLRARVDGSHPSNELLRDRQRCGN